MLKPTLLTAGSFHIDAGPAARLYAILELFEGDRHVATLTHFDPPGGKTDADWAAMLGPVGA